VDSVILSPAHKTIASRFFSSRPVVPSDELNVVPSTSASSSLSLWVCACCEAKNPQHATSCDSCLTIRGPNCKLTEPDSTISSGFSFGATEAADLSSAGNATGFTFGGGPAESSGGFGDSFLFGGSAMFGDAPISQSAPATTEGFSMASSSFANPSAVSSSVGSGWKCDCCEAENSASAPSCGTCLVPKPSGAAKNKPSALSTPVSKTTELDFGNNRVAGPMPTEGFSMASVPVTSSASLVGGWKCACCESENGADVQTCGTCLVPKPNSQAKPVQQSFTPVAQKAAPLSAFKSESKPKDAPASSGARSWKCACCEVENSASSAVCSSCLVPMPSAAGAGCVFSQVKVVEQASPVVASKIANVDWTCTVCDTTNEGTSERCYVCKVAKKTTVGRHEGSSFDPPSVAQTTEPSAAHKRIASQLRALFFRFEFRFSKKYWFSKRFFASRSKTTFAAKTPASPFTPATEPSNSNASFGSDKNSSMSDVTFNFTPVGTGRKRTITEFVSPEVLRYEKKHISKSDPVPSPLAVIGGWKCNTCDWTNEANSSHCVLCLDEK
jgi:hypothetical protein